MPTSSTTTQNQSASYGGLIALCTIFRIALIFPLGIYTNIGQNHYNVIKGNEKLHNGTYTPVIELGEKIVATWGNDAFYWNWVIFIPAIYILPPLNIIIVGVDMLWTFWISKATNYQTGVIPHSKGPCNPKNNGNFTNLQRPPGTNESFFQAAARLNATVTTPQKMCESFVQEWQYGVAMSFFYAMIVLIGICAFFNHLHMVRKQGISLFEHSLKSAKLLITLPLQCILGLLLAIFWLLPFVVPQIIFRSLPVSVKAPVRSGRRHAVKAKQGVEQKMEAKIRAIKKLMNDKKNPRVRYQGGEGESSPLSNFLGIYDIFMLVIEDLHYLDVMNLSLVSKSVREAVLPVHDFERRKFVIGCYACRSSSKFKCWACHNTTCSECSQQPLVPQTRLLHHFDFCHPYCTPCYNTHILRHRPATRNAKPEPDCRCAVKLKKGNLPKYSRQVCRDCNLCLAADLATKREQRIKFDLKLGLQNSGEKWTKCASAGCTNNLGPGPRWWVCKDAGCGKECRSSMHQAWGEDSKTDEEQAVAERPV